MIPKVIHYCWFGGNPLPELAKKCIASWKKFLPDYEIKEWNESNYDVRKIPYIAEAYEAKKYAFVSDYARFDILNEYGGVYFDTDVEVIKDMSPILTRGAFAGIESSAIGAALAAGLGIASPAARAIYKEILDSYKDDHFIQPDGTMNLKTVVLRVSEIFERYGFKKEDKLQEVAGFTIYPTEYFCPKDFETGELCITENTYTIHHFDASWLPETEKKYRYDKRQFFKSHSKPIAKILTFIAFCKWQIIDLGFFGFVKKSIRKIKEIIRKEQNSE